MAAVFGNKSFTINDWLVDPASGRIIRGADSLKLDPQNMKVLEVLASRPGEVISQTEIEQSAWPGVVVTPNSVYQSIAQLRKALGDDRSSPKYIETIARKGYRCVAAVQLPGSNPGLDSDSFTAVPAKATQRSRLPILGMVVLAMVSGLIVYSLIEDRSAELLQATLPHIPEKEGVDQRIRALIQMASSASDDGHPRKAMDHLQEALSLAKTAVREDDPLIGDILTRIAEAYYWQGESESTRVIAEEALRILELSGSQMDPRQIIARNILSEVLIEMEEFAAAEFHIQRATNLAERLYGSIDPNTIVARSTLARLRIAQNRWSDAERISREVLDRQAVSRGTENFHAVYYRLLLALALYQLDRPSESVDQARLALETLRHIARDDHLYVAAAQQHLADALLMMGNYDEAEQVSRTCLVTLKNNDWPPWRVAKAASSLGEALLKKGSLEEAEHYLRYAARTLEGQSGPELKLARTRNERRLSLLNLEKHGDGR